MRLIGPVNAVIGSRSRRLPATTSGETNFGGLGIIIPQKFAAEQAAFMLQGSYKFGDSCCAGALK
jgi:hypothetical protein